MKQLFTLSLALFLTGIVSAQSPIVTNVIASNLTGRTVNAHVVNSPPFNEGNAGAAQTWDFSSFTFSSGGSSTFVNPISAFGYSNFTNCTDALRSVAGSTTTHTFNRLDGNVYSLMGLSQQSSQGNLVIIYDNYQDVYRFPMTLNSTFTDNFHANADYGSSYTLRRGGSITALVDGYGTLKTPAGTFTNTLRVKLTQKVIDSFFMAGSLFDEEETNSVSYNWISQSYPGLTLMNISTGQGPFEAIDYAFYVDANTTSINETADSQIRFSVFPNPSNGVIHLNFDEYPANGVVSLFDAIGREVYTKQIMDIDETIYTHQIPGGTYLLKVSSENSIVTKRIMIE